MRGGEEQEVPAACLDVWHHSVGGYDAAVNSEWTIFFLLFFSASLLLFFTFNALALHLPVKPQVITFILELFSGEIVYLKCGGDGNGYLVIEISAPPFKRHDDSPGLVAPLVGGVLCTE